MKRSSLITCGLVGLFTCGANLLGAENILTVTTPTTLTAAGTNYYDGASIRADYTIDNASEIAYVHITNATGRVDLGPESGDHPVITVKNAKARLYSFSGTAANPEELNNQNGPLAVIGANGGSATFVVTNAAGLTMADYVSLSLANTGLYLRKLTVSPNARTEAETLDVMRLQKGATAGVRLFSNENTVKPVRFLFEGGMFQMSYYGGQDPNLFTTVQGGETILEGVDGNAINLVKSYTGQHLAAGQGRFVTTGSCDVVMLSLGETWGSNRLRWWLDDADINWLHSGNLVLSRSSWLQLRADNKLPVGPQTGNVVVQGIGGSDNIYAVLDLNGHVAAVNGVITEGVGVVSNVSTSAASTLRLGTFNDDGVLRAKMGPNVIPEKWGQGILTVSDTTADTLKVKEGSVAFGTGNQFRQPVEFSPGTFVSMTDPTDDRLLRLSVQQIPEHTGTPGIAYIKNDEGVEYLRGGEHLDGTALIVRSGTAKFTGGTNDKWWRLTVKHAINGDNGNKASGMELNALTLWATNVAVKGTDKGGFSLSGAWNNKRPTTLGVVTNSVAFMSAQNWDGTDYSALPAGTCMRPAAERVTPQDLDRSGRDYSGEPDSLFGLSDTGVRYDNIFCYGSTGPKGNIKTDDPASWAQIVWRLPDNAPETAGYGLCRTAWSVGPDLWQIESSADGRNWTVRDEHQAYWNPAATNIVEAPTVAIAYSLGDYPAVPSSLKSTASCGLWYNQGRPYRFTQGATAAERVVDVKVEIAAGATLDTDYLLDAAYSVAELTVDCSTGAGTLTKFSPAANGVLRLKNVGEEGLANGYEVPITVGRVVHAANLAGWSVVADGRPLGGLSVALRADKLVLKRAGMTLLFR